ncbi:MAG: flagellar protein FlaG [Thermosulfidibacteraceae bacterium]|jgi:flagellar protein FlaG
MERVALTGKSGEINIGEIQRDISVKSLNGPVNRDNKENKENDKVKSILQERKNEELKSILNKINDMMKLFEIERRYHMDKVMKEVVVKFIDMKENKIIDQIPPEEVVKRYHKMVEYFKKLFGL